MQEVEKASERQMPFSEVRVKSEQNGLQAVSAEERDTARPIVQITWGSCLITLRT